MASVATAIAIQPVSEANQTTKASFTSAGGRFAQMIVALRDGWYAADGVRPTAEDITHPWSEICGRAGEQAPRNVYDEFIGIPQLARQGPSAS